MIDARLRTKTVVRVSERIKRGRYAEFAYKISNVSYCTAAGITYLMDRLRLPGEAAVRTVPVYVKIKL